MVSELESMGIKLMVSIWPTIDPRSENYAYMRERNYILRGERGVDVVFMFFGPQTYVDTTHPGAQEFFWSRAKKKKNYYDYGIRTFWLDEAEPEMRPYDYDNVRMYLGNGEEVSNIYCVGFAKAFYDGLKARVRKCATWSDAHGWAPSGMESYCGRGTLLPPLTA